jgi:hypothetical protein
MLMHAYTDTAVAAQAVIAAHAAHRSGMGRPGLVGLLTERQTKPCRAEVGERPWQFPNPYQAGLARA